METRQLTAIRLYRFLLCVYLCTCVLLFQLAAIHRWIDRLMDGQTEGWIDIHRQMGRLRDRRTDRQIESVYPSLNLYIFPFACLSICLFIRQSVFFLFIPQSVYLLSIHPLVCLSVFISIIPQFVYSFVYLSVHPYVCPSLYLSICLSFHPSTCLSTDRQTEYAYCIWLLIYAYS